MAFAAALVVAEGAVLPTGSTTGAGDVPAKSFARCGADAERMGRKVVERLAVVSVCLIIKL
jgi:hypothetical protein